MMVKKAFLTLACLFVISAANATPIEPVCEDYPHPCNADFSKETWKNAYDLLYQKISTEYPYTDWRGINWQTLYQKYLPLVTQAENEKNYFLYYEALDRFLSDVHDGHVRVRVDENDKSHSQLIQNKIDAEHAAGYGFTVLKKRDKYIVDQVLFESDADKAGISKGTEITSWNNQPMDEAVAATSLVWVSHPRDMQIPATTEELNYQQLRFLVRDNEAAVANITFLNHHSSQTIQLTAKKSSEQTDLNDSMRLVTDGDDNSDMIVAHLLNGKNGGQNAGYIKIRALHPNPNSEHTKDETAYFKVLKDALTRFRNNHVQNIILDLSGSLGGYDAYAAKILGYFYAESPAKPYYGSNFLAYDYELKTFTPTPDTHIKITPQKNAWTGEMLCLTNMDTMSAAELLAFNLKQNKRALIWSEYQSTHGSAGSLAQGIVKMPDGLLVDYADARNVSPDGKIYVDSDKNGEGGVKTDRLIQSHDQDDILKNTE